MAGIKVRDSRQLKFLGYYMNPSSETFNNALQSALRAGYARRYAIQIVSLGTKWIQESTRKRQTMLVKAERNLDAMLDLDITNRGVTKDGKEVYEYDDTGKLKIKADVSKFVAERIGKTVYGTREEPKGDTYIQNNFFDAEQLKRIARRVQNGDSTSEESTNRLPNSDESQV